MKNQLCQWHDAVKLLSNILLAKSVEPLPLGKAIGRQLAEDVVAVEDYPRFRSSAMDGWALRKEDLRDGRQNICVVGQILAGDSPIAISKGETVGVMTGAPVPDEADGVVPVEYAREIDGRLEWDTDVTTTHIRERGEDFKAGQLLLEQNVRLTPTHAMLLASAGVKECLVYAKPDVVVLKSGNEVSETPDIYEIFDGTADCLRHLVEACGGNLKSENVVKDNLNEVIFNIKKHVEANVKIIITTGGVSAGVADFIPAAVEALGGTIHLHKLAIKPAKPLLIATFLNGTVLVGLPGNPVSQLVGFTLAVQPLMEGRAPLDIRTVQARLGEDVIGKKNLLTFLRAKTSVENTRLMARVLPGQESFKVLNLNECDSWILVRENLHAGEVVEVLRFPHEQGAL